MIKGDKFVLPDGNERRTLRFSDRSGQPILMGTEKISYGIESSGFYFFGEIFCMKRQTNELNKHYYIDQVKNTKIQVEWTKPCKEGVIYTIDKENNITAEFFDSFVPDQIIFCPDCKMFSFLTNVRKKDGHVCPSDHVYCIFCDDDLTGEHLLSETHKENTKDCKTKNLCVKFKNKQCRLKVPIDAECIWINLIVADLLDAPGTRFNDKNTGGLCEWDSKIGDILIKKKSSEKCNVM